MVWLVGPRSKVTGQSQSLSMESTNLPKGVTYLRWLRSWEALDNLLIKFFIHNSHIFLEPQVFHSKQKLRYHYLEVSINGGTRVPLKSSIYRWIFHFKPSSSWGTPIFRKPPSDAAKAWPQHRNFGLQNAAKVCLTTKFPRATTVRVPGRVMCYPLVMTNVAIENDHL